MAATRKNNVTLAIDSGLLKRVRALAAKQGCSVSGLLAAALQELVANTQQYEAASRRARALLTAGFSLGGATVVDRQAIHERRRIG